MTKIKGVKLVKTGNSYCFIIPRSVVDKLDIFKLNFKYDLDVTDYTMSLLYSRAVSVY